MGASFEVNDPSTGNTLGSVADASPADGMRAPQSAARAQASFAAMPPRQAACAAGGCAEACAGRGHAQPYRAAAAQAATPPGPAAAHGVFPRLVGVASVQLNVESRLGARRSRMTISSRSTSREPPAQQALRAAASRAPVSCSAVQVRASGKLASAHAAATVWDSR